ncbi:hypothetical protein BO70DRAFT_367708 [Aspergillus heteromorphus CBS 117.55]|uniref:Zn(2)-C6 fungal-type domain-containing protein n=1 Tax=Aspergillus heteromorphus CBS 117.55 TaxID=1448321 RepID=A0A317X7R5_9EURO|nr:uncharacterized protein BO70DRAFT_367708 [Aspergillus heteromorphus CBS 117.55]PWY92640.1 hypothetical protein BO70DRAFT_367708 [Aspergillus heteromorphus CBS 117.55]
MASRLAACEACRKAKVACDHKRPACTRCASNNNAAICIYRAAPFKRRRTDVSPSRQTSRYLPPHSPVNSSPSSPSFTPRTTNPYPNPGFLGSSSHVAIFNHISPDDDSHGPDAYHASNSDMTLLDPQSAGDNILLIQGADILKQLLNTFPLPAMRDLVLLWLAKGTNLALAEPFTQQCSEHINQLFMVFSQEAHWHLAYARRLLENSRRPLIADESSEISSFSAQFLGQNYRWESMGIFLCAVSRATIDVAFYPALYTSEKDQIALRKLSTRMSDLALDIALSLDCLNDLQLVLQYENFILHSHVNGDQSYHSWSRLGNVLTSMFALGYHENVEKTRPRRPPFLIELRKAACATAYSADKNVAVFLGRPPRMSKRFCHFQVPLTPTGPDQSPNASSVSGDVTAWDPNTPFSYRAELRWSALCASLKEEILELFRDKRRETYSQRASAIENEAHAQWMALPSHFRLACSLRECSQSPFERDFLAGVRLNHLHVLFLLRLLSLDTLTEPDRPVVDVSEQILSLVVEIILLRDQLVNSGTGLVWKVAHYGLPSAGILLLSMLRQQSTQHAERTPWSKPLLNLGIFVAQIQAGSIVRPGDPNYALISKATHTIDRFLDSVHREGALHDPARVSSRVEEGGDWAALFSQDLYDFEAAFWQNVADHPSLLGPEAALSDI